MGRDGWPVEKSRLSRVAKPLVITSLILTCVTSATSAQRHQVASTTILHNVASCPRCSLVLSQPIRVGDRDGPGAFTRWPFSFHHSITVDASGNIFVGVRDGSSYVPWRFDVRSGKFLGLVGRVGTGPGEFLFPSVMQVLPGDSLLVLDQNQHRYSVLAPRTYRWVRGGPLPGATYDLLPLEGGRRFVINAPVYMRDAAGYPLHLFTAAGDLLRSFGADTAKLDPSDPSAGLRVLASSRDSSFWSGYSIYQYRIDLLSASGTVLRSLRRSPAWYPPLTRKDLKPVSPTTPPQPYLLSMREMSDGYLWVAFAVPDPRWGRGLTRTKKGEGGSEMVDVADWEGVYDTMLEVIDVERGQVVVTQRFDQFITSILPDHRVVAVNVDDLQPFLTVYRVAIAGRAR